MKLDRELHDLTGLSTADLRRVLNVLCPMHLFLTPTGHITHVGPTLAKLRPEQDLIGTRFLEVFSLDRPRAITTMNDLMAREESKLHLEFRDPPQTGLKGVLVPLPQNEGALVNLSFGISIVDGVRDYGLNNADFAPTDLTVEMLYLVEAKTAAMEASKKLNLRLQGAKLAAELQAYTDTLTGLKNRRAADHILEKLISERRDFTLMQVDLDYFKAVNDTLGHAAGDTVLQAVAKVMERETRDEDFIARVGGDEFMIVFEGLTEPTRLADLASRLISELEKPIPFKGTECRISASIGIARNNALLLMSVEDVVRASDKALYASKNNGRGCYSFSNELQG